MNKQRLIWTLAVAVPVGLAALAAGYVYRDTGRVPFQEQAADPAPAGSTSVAKQQAADDGPDAAPETVQSAQTPAVQEEAGENAPVKGPSFDVVGVESTGETVVAGRSEAGAIVALTANGKVVGKTIANEVGEWTIILDEPLKPGDYDVGLEVHDDQGTAIEQSEQRLAVSLAEDGNEKPLVVLNTPDGPSNILQKPATEQQVADLQGKEDMSGSETAGTVVAAVQESPDDADPAVSGQQAAAPADDGQAPDTGEVSAVAEGAAPAGQQTGTQQDIAGVAAPGTADETGKPSKTSDGAAPTVTASAEAISGETSAPEADASAPAVTVEAVESEKDRVYVAGTGVPGSSVRVYVGEDFQGEAKVNSSGRWLVEGDKNVAEGNVEVRADLIAEGGDSVDARAAVTFSKEEDRQIVLTKVLATGVSGDAGTQGAEVQKALPVVIIRKGDNLWRISRRLYGDGVRYTTIYQANKEQIRNPDLIYPGQVFLTPEEDRNWASPDEDNGRNG